MAGATSLSIVELLPRGALFLLVRWLFVLPGLLLVLVGLEFVTRRTGFARAIFLLVALVPMIWWELTQSSGDTSSMSLILGATAVLFAIVARVPDRIPATPPAASDPTPPNPETAVAPR